MMIPNSRNMKKLPKIVLLIALVFAFLVLCLYFTSPKKISVEVPKPTSWNFTELYKTISLYSKEVELAQRKAIFEGKPLVPPFIEMESKYVIAPKYDLTICKIKKSMSTMMSGIGCVLYDTEEFMRQNRSILEWWDKRMCAGRNEYERIDETKSAINQNSTKIAVIRDPITRFISFFTDKCIREVLIDPINGERCYNCGRDVECFLKNQYERFMLHSKPGVALTKSYVDLHSAPLSWNCEFEQFMKDYKFVKMSSHPELRKEGLYEIMQILESKNVSSGIIDFIMKSAIGNDTEHSTFGSEATVDVKRQIETNPVVQDYLRRIYFLDFIIFGFDYPHLWA